MRPSATTPGAAQKHRAALAEKTAQGRGGRERGHRGRRDKAGFPDRRQGDQPGADRGPVPKRLWTARRRPAAPAVCSWKEEKAIPYGAAPQGNPDARADYGEFTVLAEVTTILDLRKSDIGEQWTSAGRHVDAVTDSPRIYCLMVSRLGLDDDETMAGGRACEGPARPRRPGARAGGSGGCFRIAPCRPAPGSGPGQALANRRGFAGAAGRQVPRLRHRGHGGNRPQAGRTLRRGWHRQKGFDERRPGHASR